MTPRAPHQPVMMIEGICNAISIAFVPVHEEAFENAQLVILITICNDIIKYSCGNEFSFCDLLCMDHFGYYQFGFQ